MFKFLVIIMLLLLLLIAYVIYFVSIFNNTNCLETKDILILSALFLSAIFIIL